MVFSLFTEMYNCRHKSVLEHFVPVKKELYSLSPPNLLLSTAPGNQ